MAQSSPLETFITPELLAPHWEKFSSFGHENQVMVRIGHLNPELLADPKLIHYGLLSSTETHSVIALGVPTTKGNIGSFWEGMEKSAEMGMIRGYSPEKIREMRKQSQEVHGPEKFDITADLTIIKHVDEAAAATALANIKNVREGGIMETVIPGAGGQSSQTLGEVLKNTEAFRNYLTPEQREKMKEFQKQMPKIKAEMQEQQAKMGVEYQETTFLGFPAIKMQAANKPIVPKPSFVPKAGGDKKEFRGGGGITSFPPLPKRPPKMQDKLESYLGVQVGKYLVSGGLIWGVNFYDSADTPCYSLKKFKSRTVTENIEGKIFTTTEIIPQVSTYGAEGYMNREEAESILKALFKKLA